MSTAAVQVYYWSSKDNGSVEQRVFHADEDSAILINLLPYTQYIITVLAYSAAGDGPTNNPPLYVTTAESGNSAIFFAFFKLLIKASLVNILIGLSQDINCNEYQSNTFSC